MNGATAGRSPGVAVSLLASLLLGTPTPRRRRSRRECSSPPEKGFNLPDDLEVLSSRDREHRGPGALRRDDPVAVTLAVSLPVDTEADEREGFAGVGAQLGGGFSGTAGEHERIHPAECGNHRAKLTSESV